MLSVRDLEHRYRLYLHTQLNGDRSDVEGIDFGLWLDAHWQETPPLWRDACLMAAATEGPGGSPVVWIETGDEILGLLAGRPRGCYRVPLDSAPPVVALFLDDAPECSTGSIHQERASTAIDVAVRIAPTVAMPVLEPVPAPAPAPVAALPQASLEPAFSSPAG